MTALQSLAATLDGIGRTRVNLRRTEGRRRLLAVVYGLSQAVVGRELGVHPSAVGQWCAGKTRPSLELRRAIHAAYGIEPDAWGPICPNWRTRPTYLVHASSVRR